MRKRRQSAITDNIEDDVESISVNGCVKSIRGSVVDVVFQSQLPQINQMLLVGSEQHIVLEVYSSCSRIPHPSTHLVTMGVVVKH